MKRLLRSCFAVLLLAPVLALAGGGPLNTLVVVNSASRELIGYEPEELRGKRFHHFFRPEDLREHDRESGAVTHTLGFGGINTCDEPDGKQIIVASDGSWTLATALEPEYDMMSL